MILKRDYLEASSIIELTPRGACALARLSLQKLLAHIGCEGKNINLDIANLVANGLDPKIQKAMGFVRLIGNDSVHPGQIDLRDDKNSAITLLSLINVIAERLISEQKRIDQLYSSLPEAKRDQINQRDKK